MIIPRCSRGTIMVRGVVSCPPWVVAVEVNKPAGFPSRVPSSQSLAVESISFFIWAAMLP